LEVPESEGQSPTRMRAPTREIAASVWSPRKTTKYRRRGEPAQRGNLGVSLRGKVGRQACDALTPESNIAPPYCTSDELRSSIPGTEVIRWCAFSGKISAIRELGQFLVLYTPVDDSNEAKSRITRIPKEFLLRPFMYPFAHAAELVRRPRNCLYVVHVEPFGVGSFFSTTRAHTAQEPPRLAEVGARMLARR
jgi:hypothetical protein